MTYKKVDIGEVDTDVVYVSKKELMARTGVPRSTMHNHMVTGKLNGIIFRNRTYIHPDDADEYEKIIKCGLLG